MKTIEMPRAVDEELLVKLRAVANPVRYRILQILAERGDCQCGSPGDELPIAPSTLSQHLKVLREAGRGGVHQRPEGQLLAAHHGHRGEDAAEDPAEEGDAALPHGEHLERAIRVVSPVVQRVGESGADESADRGSVQHRVNDLVVNAEAPGGRQQEPSSGDEPDRGEDPVWGDLQRAELERHDRIELEEGDRGHRRPDTGGR